MAELKTVIAVRAEETQRREEAAILKMGSDIHLTVADKDKVRNDIPLTEEEEESDGHTAVENRSEETVTDSGIISGNEQSHSNEDCHLPTTSQKKNSESNNSRQNSHSTFFHGVDPKTRGDPTEPETTDSRSLDSVRDFDAKQYCLSVDGDNQSTVGPFSSAIARMAAAKSYQMATFKVETFGSSSSDEEDDDDDELPVNEHNQ